MGMKMLSYSRKKYLSKNIAGRYSAIFFFSMQKTISLHFVSFFPLMLHSIVVFCYHFYMNRNLFHWNHTEKPVYAAAILGLTKR